MNMNAEQKQMMFTLVVMHYLARLGVHKDNSIAYLFDDRVLDRVIKDCAAIAGVSDSGFSLASPWQRGVAINLAQILEDFRTNRNCFTEAQISDLLESANGFM